MPHALVSLPDTYVTVQRRVAVDLMRDLARRVRLPGETQLLLPGASDVVPMNKGNLKDCCDEEVIFPNDSRLVVRFSEEADESYALTTAVATRENLPVFWDETRDITIRPVYRYVKMNITVEYTASSRVEIQRWIDEQRSRIAMERGEFYHDLEYHYALPDKIHLLLMDLHKLAEKQAPLGLSFNEYFNEYKYHPTTVVETLSSTAQRVVFNEHQLGALGWFSFTSTPEEPEKDGESGAYRTSFTYSLQYNRPMQLYCRWPMVVHNQLIPRKYFGRAPYKTLFDQTHKVSKTKGALDAVVDAERYKGLPYIQTPLEDDWVPTQRPSGYLMFFQALVGISPEDPRSLLDLRDLGEFSFDPYVLEYLYHQGDGGVNSGLFRIELHENNTRLSIPLVMDGLTVKATRDLDLQKVYHIRIGLLENWMTLGRPVTDCLRRYPQVTATLLKALGVRSSDEAFVGLKRLGVGVPRPSSSAQCPGTGAPPSEGGTGGPLTPDNPFDPNNPPSPTHPDGTENPEYTAPGDSQEDGVVGRGDMDDAVKDTDDNHQNYFKGQPIGPMTVMLAGLITRKRSL